MTHPPLTPWEIAKRHTLGIEAGKLGQVTDDPNDSGGPTGYGGITQPTLDEAIRRRIAPRGTTLASLTHLQVEDIYRRLYWDEAGCQRIVEAGSPAFAVCVFDAAIHSGPGMATRWLQRALSVGADGAVGPRTTAAIRGASATHEGQRSVLAEMRDLRAAYNAADIKRNPRKKSFARGWSNRREATYALCVGLLQVKQEA